MTRYLSVAEAVAIHDVIMDRTSSAPEPLRDEGLLESALMRGQTAAAHYEDANLLRQAVLTAVGISQNQPFVDGNKRAAYAVLDIFLRMNGRVYTGDPIELARQLESFAEQRDSRSVCVLQFEDWLREKVEPGR